MTETPDTGALVLWGTNQIVTTVPAGETTTATRELRVEVAFPDMPGWTLTARRHPLHGIVDGGGEERHWPDTEQGRDKARAYLESRGPIAPPARIVRRTVLETREVVDV